MRTIGNVNKHGEIRATASGAITKGVAVVVNNDGTVSAVAGTYRQSSFGTPVQIDGTNSISQVTGCMVGSGKFSVSYRNSSGQGGARIGTISGTSITLSGEYNFSDSYTLVATSLYDKHRTMYIPSVDRIVWVWQRDANKYGYIRAATPNTSTNEFNTPGTSSQVGTSTDEDDDFALAYDIADSRIICVYRDDYQGYSKGRAFALNTGTNALTGGGAVEVPKKPATGGSGFHAAYPCGVYDTQNNNCVFLFRDNDNAGDATSVQAYLSGSTLSWSATTVPLGAGRNCMATACVADTASNKGYFAVDTHDHGTNIISIFSRSPDSSAPYNGSNTRWNLARTKGGADGAALSVAYDSTSDKLIVFGYDQLTNRNNYLKNFNRSTTGNDFFSAVYKTDIVEYQTTGPQYHSREVFYDSTSDQCILLYISDEASNGTGNSYGVAQTYQNPRATETKKVTDNNFIGFAKSGAANGDTVTIQTQGSILKDKSGLVAGTDYYVQSDGSIQTAENWLGVDAVQGSHPNEQKVFAGTAISTTELKIKG